MSDKIGRYGENVNYKRYNFRSNVDMDITKTTVVNLGVQGNVTDNMEPVEGSAERFPRPLQGRRAGRPRRPEQPL